MRWPRRRQPPRHPTGRVVYSPSPGPVSHQCMVPWATFHPPGTVWQCDCTRRWESRRVDAPTVTRCWWRELARDEPLPGTGDGEGVPPVEG